MRALKVTAKGETQIVEAPLPQLRPGYILVRIICVALNPLDSKNVYDISASSTVLGTDYAGVVERIGERYSKRWEPGDRIFGFVYGGNVLQPTDGAFAEYALAKADVQYRMPDNLTFEQAASLGVALGTAALGLHHKLRIPLEMDDDVEDSNSADRKVLIYGGSTATGTMSLQLARLASWLPITTCSPNKFDLVGSYGAAAAFDYRDSHCVSKVCSAAGGKFTRVFDTISSPESARICADSMADGAEAMYCSTLVLEGRFPKRKIQPKRLVLWTGLGEDVSFMGHEIPAIAEDFEFLRRFVPIVEELLTDGMVRCHPILELSGGLEGIPDGLARLHANEVSGYKLVCRIASL